MLRIDDLSFSIDGRPLFEGASAFIPAGHKVGLVGRNGTGKTTLFRLIRGELAPAGGQITLSSGARVGGVAQEVPAGPESLIDTVLAADAERAALMAEAEVATDGARIAEIHTRLADIDAWSAEARAASILSGLGFDGAAQARACAEFSGGWRMRVALAGVLFSAPDLLLLDEPTNYLDLEGALWLESYLARYPHTVLLISHDRGLLNRGVGSILHLAGGRLTLYGGPYDTFARERAQRAAQAEAGRRKQEARRAHLQGFVDRFRAKASKARQAQSRLKMLARMEPIPSDLPEEEIRFVFPEPDALSPPVIALEGAAVGYDGRAVLRGLDLRIDEDDRIALLGANGQGKSTLSKLLAGRLQPLSGRMTRARNLRVGFFAQHQLDELDAGASPLEHLARARPGEPPARARARLAQFGLGAAQADLAAGLLSGGQRARLALLLATLDAPQILILDEPTNHLDIDSRAALVEALSAYTGAVILVSHDPHLIGLVADRLWLVRDGAVRVWEDDLEAYARLLLAERSAPPKARAAEPAPAGAAAPEAPAPAPAPPRADRATLSKLRAEARAAEDRVDKLEGLRARADARLADPALYAPGQGEEIARLQRQRAEIAEALERAEALWLAALDRLERAGAA